MSSSASSLTATHRCPAPGCAVPINNRSLMCPAHWRLVPPGLQQAVYRTWRARSIPAHQAAVKAALKAVAQALGAPIESGVAQR